MVQTGRLRPPPATPRKLMRGVPPSHRPGVRSVDPPSNGLVGASHARPADRPPQRRDRKRWGRSRVSSDGSWGRGPPGSPSSPPHFTTAPGQAEAALRRGRPEARVAHSKTADGPGPRPAGRLPVGTPSPEGRSGCFTPDVGATGTPHRVG